MGFGSVFGKIVQVAAPVIGTALGGPIGGAIGSMIGGAAGAIGANQDAKKAEGAAGAYEAQRAAAMQENLRRADQLVADNKKRSDATRQRLDADMRQAEKALTDARNAGDREAQLLHESTIQKLQENLNQEDIKSQQLENEISQKLAIPRDIARKAIAGEAKIEDQLASEAQAGVRGGLKAEQEARTFRDDIVRDAIPRSLSDIEQGLTAGRTAQDAAFQTAIQEAEKQAVQRGEDPRRATLNLKIQQAKARGSLTANELRNRALARTQIAGQANLSGGLNEASIARILPTVQSQGGSRIADLELQFAGQDVSRADVAASKGEQRRTAALVAGIESESGMRTGNISRGTGLAADLTNVRGATTTGIANANASDLQASGYGLNAASGVLTNQANNASALASENRLAAANARAQRDQAITSGVGGVGEVFKLSKKK